MFAHFTFSILTFSILKTKNQRIGILFSKCQVHLQPQPMTRYPTKERWVTYRYIHFFFFFWRQTEQCLVWNVFKEKANSAE